MGVLRTWNNPNTFDRKEQKIPNSKSHPEDSRHIPRAFHQHSKQFRIDTCVDCKFIFLTKILKRN